MPAAVTMCPRTVNMEILPCFFSINLNLSNLSSEASSKILSGSQKPNGACAPKASENPILKDVCCKVILLEGAKAETPMKVAKTPSKVFNILSILN